MAEYAHTCRHCGQDVLYRVKYRKPVACGRHECQTAELRWRMAQMAERGDGYAAAYLTRSTGTT